jgi:hypothetical protein
MAAMQFLNAVEPRWLLDFVYILLGLTLLWLGYALARAWAMRRTINLFIESLQALGPQTDDVKRWGRPLPQVMRWRSRWEHLPPPAKELAKDVERALVTLRDDEDASRSMLRDTEGAPWEETATIARFANVRLFDATPGILTGVGLIGTFVAIAVGLSNLSLGPNGEINGVTSLLGGLSGKFITSIVALGLAVIVQLLDLTVLRPFFGWQFRRLHNSVEDAFPRISAAQQSANLLESARRQERSLSNISSDVVGKFSDVFSSDLLPNLSHMMARGIQTEIGPSLDRISTSLNTLDEGIRRLENSKQESIGAELKRLTESLERSIGQSLQNMGEEFRSSLSGSADREFENASGALRTSAEVLKGMNESFEVMQSTMGRMLEETERRSAASFEQGEGRTRALNELVERSVSQLNESAHHSAGEVQRLLVDAVAGMGAKLASVTAEMEAKARWASQENLRANQQLVQEVTGAAGRTSTETERLLAALGERSDDFIAAADQLRELRQGVSQVIAQTGERVRDMNKAADAFRSVATEASTLTRTLRETQDQQRKTTETSAGTMVKVGEIVERQSALFDSSAKSLQLAKSVFGDLDERLARALGVLLEQMQNYNFQVEKNFEVILHRVNERMPELFERLEGSLQQVAELVEDLNEAVAKSREGVA